MVKNGLDAVVGAVEKVMYVCGVSDGLAMEQKEKDQKEKDESGGWTGIMRGEKKEGGLEGRG